MTKETAFHSPHLGQRTRNVVEYKGYWLPKAYSSNGPIEEYWACRQKLPWSWTCRPCASSK
jgi:aminomethyltransferase